MTSRTVDVGLPMHYADHGGDGQTVVLVHGLGGSHANWAGVGPGLARRARVLAPDLPGFGRTPPGPGGPAAVTVESCRAALDRFLDAVAPEPVVLCGNSMGGAISVLEAAARPDRVAGLVLVDPALPLPLGTPIERVVVAAFLPPLVPRLAELWQRRRRMRLGPEGVVREMLALVTADRRRVAPELVAAHVELARERFWYSWADAALVSATRSLVLALARPWVLHAAMARVAAPTLIVQGTADRLVPVAAARAAARRCPRWRLQVLEGVGHVPQLEAPERFLAAVLPWLEERGLARAADAA